jgi:acyl carrier protein
MSPAETHVERQPLSRDELITLIAAILGDDVELTTPLDDSLTKIDLVEELEAELAERTVGLRIDDEDLEELRTVGDVVDYVMARL